jgi:DNA helicase-2/ATP-dependent DNA helicase PcrA
VFEVLKRAPSVPELSHAAERAVAFVQLLEKYGPRLARKGFSQAARDLCDEVGLFEEARRGAQSLPAQARRVEALEGLLRQLVEFEKRAEQKAAEAALEANAAGGLRLAAAAAPSTEVAAEPPSAEAAASLPGTATAETPAASLQPPAALLDEEDDVFAAGLPGYLARLALDSREAEADSGDAVALMTLHGAKGLEWRAVFLCGLEEGLLPHSGRGFDDAGGDAPSADGAMNLEEERRLCYVGMTRARERLYLTLCRERLRRGKPVPRTPSRFLEDLPPELIDQIDLSGPQLEAAKEVKDAKARNFFAQMDALLGTQKPPGSPE